MAVNKIVYNGQTYAGDLNLMAGNLFLENSLANDELTVDTLTATIDGSSEIGTLYVPKGSSGYLTADGKLFYVLPYIRILVDDLSQYVYGEPVLYYRDDVLMGKFYMSSSKRVSKYSFEINCVSAIGLLDNTKHYGGIYTGIPMKDLLADIVGGIIPYTLDPIFLNLPVFGWLPVATRRENLHQLLFAEGATIKKDANADIVFTYLKSGAATEIADDRIFIGGSVDYSTPVDTVKVLEHSYIAYDNQELTSLYEDAVPDNTITTPNGNTVSGALVLFDNPMFSLTIENGTILEQGANYAVLQSGGFCKLFGKSYAHTTRETIAKKPVTRGLVSIVDNTATIDNATLVSLVNGENVAKRALAYYGYAKTVNADIVVQNERPGDVVSFNDPFGEAQIGFIQAMNSNMGGMYRANTKLVTGFVPSNPGNIYNNSVILTGKGSWIVPTGVYKIRAAIIEAGQGGQSGESGKSATKGPLRQSGYYTSYLSGTGGDGGSPGTGGSPGKVLEAEFDVTPGETLYFEGGIGGIGGVWDVEKKEGTTGTASVFNGKTSDDGAIYTNGYLDLFSGKIFAKQGKQGLSGGNGGGLDGEYHKTRTPGKPIKDQNGNIWYAGENNLEYQKYALGNDSAIGAAGAGGGAAIGANGKDGNNDGYAYIEKLNSGTLYRYTAKGGTGGAGAIPIKPEKQSGIGNGGNGGHGGGGAGSGGLSEALARTSEYIQNSINIYPGESGIPGNGGNGGDGSDGGTIVYY